VPIKCAAEVRGINIFGKGHYVQENQETVAASYYDDIITSFMSQPDLVRRKSMKTVSILTLLILPTLMSSLEIPVMPLALSPLATGS
jgi:hypothetical protein